MLSHSSHQPPNPKETKYKYICIPGTYSGDRWHILMALLIDPLIKIYILEQKESTENDKYKFVKFAKQMKNLYSVALGDEEYTKRVITAKEFSATTRQTTPAQYAKKFDEYIKRENIDPDNAKHQYASTSVLIHEVEKKGKVQTIKKIQSQLKEVFDRHISAERKKQLNEIIKPLEGGKGYILVNMRFCSYNIEHCISPSIYAQIEKECKKQDLKVIPVGIFDNNNEEHKKYLRTFKEEGRNEVREWVDGLKGTAIDIFTVAEKGKEKARESDAIETAYLWYLIAHNPRVKGYIGGRSGSTDIAAFLGVRTLTWDIKDLTDKQFVRMFLATPIMSCIGLSCPGKDGELLAWSQNGRVQNQTPEWLMASMRLDNKLLRDWLGGKNLQLSFKKGDPAGDSISLKVLREVELYRLRFLDRYRAVATSATLGTDYIPPNNDWYSPPDIHILLEEIVKTNKHLKLCDIFLKEKILDQKTLSDSLVSFKKYLASQTNKGFIFVPVNLGDDEGKGVHWTIMCIAINMKKCFYIDSYGNRTPSFFSKLLKEEKIEILRGNNLGLKEDGTNSGPWIIEVAAYVADVINSKGKELSFKAALNKINIDEKCRAQQEKLNALPQKKKRTHSISSSEETLKKARSESESTNTISVSSTSSSSTSSSSSLSSNSIFAHAPPARSIKGKEKADSDSDDDVIDKKLGMS